MHLRGGFLLAQGRTVSEVVIDYSTFSDILSRIVLSPGGLVGKMQVM